MVGNSNTWRIGAYGATPAGFFDGLIDNVRIYDRALSASEVQSDMSLRIQAGGDAADRDGEDPGSGCYRRQRRRLGDRDVQRADERGHDHDESSSS